jgi:hypothetical protein
VLTKPSAGWTNVVVGEFSDSASYLDDVPEMTLHGMLYFFRTGNPFCVEYDAEGHEFTVVSNHYETIVVEDEKTHRYFVSADKLAHELIQDIEDNLDLWAKWNPGAYEETEPEEVELAKAKISDLLQQLRVELEKYDKKMEKWFKLPNDIKS